MTITLEIVRFAPMHISALTRFFSHIGADSASQHFHPHPFTVAEAERICSNRGKDIYAGMCRAGEFLGYGMLRGWDAGYTIPSLGIYIAPELRGTGAARLLMQYLHLAARLSGAKHVRLKVYRENKSAYGLYESMGYHFTSANESESELVGMISL